MGHASSIPAAAGVGGGNLFNDPGMGDIIGLHQHPTRRRTGGRNVDEGVIDIRGRPAVMGVVTDVPVRWVRVPVATGSGRSAAGLEGRQDIGIEVR